MPKSLPNIEVLRKLLLYDPGSGILFWRPRGVLSWDARYAGKRAFSDNGQGYLAGTIKGRAVKAHRVAWAMHHGEWPKLQIDHINGIRSDNRIDNLREVSNRQNAQNRRRQLRNKTGVTGVQWREKDQKWWASIGVNWEVKSLGLFDRFEDAVAARRMAERKFCFHPNHGG